MSSDETTRILPGVPGAAVGTQLSGIYELDERIASGGMGEVYRGHNIQTGDPVAIKIVLPEFARDETILSLFKKEASILNHLSHDTIVRYHVFTVDPGIRLPYLAMEFVDGESLIEVMRRGPMTPDDVRKLCLRIASGLAAAHEAGIVHRDLSPDNIILPGGRVDRAKIIDFGIARSAIVGGETLLGGRFAGKYNYVSPEQLGLFGGEVSEQTDVYSLGLVLAAAARGEPLDMNGSQVDVIEKRRVVPDLSDIDAELRPLVEAMLQPRPEDRPPGMAEIAAWLAQGMGERPAATMPPLHTMPPLQMPPFSAASVPPASLPPRGAALSPGTGVALDAEAASGAAARQVPAFSLASTGGNAAASRVSESPFGPLLAQPEMPFTRGPAAPPPAAHKSGVRLAFAAAAVLVAAVGGAYYGGLFGPAPTGPAETPDSATDEPLFAPREQVAEVDTIEQPEDSVEPATETPVEEAPEAAIDEASLERVREPAVGQQEARDPVASPARQPPESDMAEVIGDVARRVSWLKDYAGGACFFVTTTLATDKRIEIEGFGTSVEPFAELLEEFRGVFGIEPDIGVRLIQPEQCVITDFLRGMSDSTATAPALTLDQSVIASGAEVRGQIAKLNGRKTDLILIDHKGMAYNINRHLSATGETATFSINVGLAGADQMQNRSAPQIVVAVTSRNGIEAANFTGPTPASDIFPRILTEIGAQEPGSGVSAKYFRLSG